jgi:hypothetical protein
MLAVGIWAAQLRGSAIWLLPVTFVGVMSLGGLAGAAGLLIPGAEPIILFSCLVFGVLITRRIRFSSHTNVTIVAFFAFFHGFAHGQEISTSVSLISYTLGFMVATILLHGAGILVVRLLVMIFALFLSHLAYAQAATNSSTDKSTIQIQTTNFHELIIAAHPNPPDNRHNRQLLYSDKHGVSFAASEQHHITNTPLFTDCGCNFMRLLHCTVSNIAFVAITDFLIKHQPGIQFLTNGVGVTSPPIASIYKNTSRFCSAAVFCHLADIHVNDDYQATGNTPNFDLLPAIYSLATSFLTNGIGATSPPILLAYPVVTSLNLSDIAFGNSTPYKSSIALNPSVSRELISSNSLAAQTRLKSRLHSFAIALQIPIDRRRWSPSATKHLNKIL